MNLRLYKLTRTDRLPDYDYYDALIVAASSPEIAIGIKPDRPETWTNSIRFVEWECLGLASDRVCEGVVMGQYHCKRIKNKSKNPELDLKIEAIKVITSAIEKKLMDMIL